MGLDVGVVTISYLEAPESPAYDFLLHLARDVFLGCDDEEYEEDTHDGELYTWGGSWGGNTVVEFSRSYLTWKADGWAKDQSVGAEGQDALQRWIGDLPWSNDMIMLHLGS